MTEKAPRPFETKESDETKLVKRSRDRNGNELIVPMKIAPVEIAPIGEKEGYTKNYAYNADKKGIYEHRPVYDPQTLSEEGQAKLAKEQADWAREAAGAAGYPNLDDKVQVKKAGQLVEGHITHYTTTESPRSGKHKYGHFSDEAGNHFPIPSENLSLGAHPELLVQAREVGEDVLDAVGIEEPVPDVDASDVHGVGGVAKDLISSDTLSPSEKAPRGPLGEILDKGVENQGMLDLYADAVAAMNTARAARNGKSAEDWKKIALERRERLTPRDQAIAGRYAELWAKGYRP